MPTLHKLTTKHNDVPEEDAALLGYYKGKTFSRSLTLSGDRPVREVEEVHECLHVSPRQDVLANSSPVHALKILLCHLLLRVVAAAFAGAGASARTARRSHRAVLFGRLRVPRVGG